MPNILFDCERMKYPHTGLYTFCHELGTALLQQAQADERFVYYIPSKLGQQFGANAGYIWQRSLHKFYFPQKEKMDVWHTTYQSSPYKPRKKGTPRVLTIHDLNFLHEQKSKEKEKKYLAAVQRNVDEADQLVAISQFAMAETLRHVNTQNKPFHVIYNGATVQEFPGFDAPRERPVLPFLFAMGTVLPKKNFHILPCLVKDQNMELIIAGNINEAYRDKILAEAKQHRVMDQVKIIGPITEEEKYWYLKNCTAFVFPSLAEGFGLPVIEAMHFGKPVFLSDRTSLPEIGGDAAYYFYDFDPGYMQEVLKEGLAHFRDTQKAQAVREHAAQFSWDKAAAAYMQIYRELY